MWRYMGVPCAPLRLRLCSRFTRCAEVVAPCSIILRLSQSEWRMVDRYNHFPSSILHSQLKTPERTSFRGFALCFGFLILREHDIEQNRNKCCRYNTGTAKNQLNRLRRLCQNGHIGTHAVADTQSNRHDGQIMSMPIIALGGRFVIAISVLPTSSSGS